MIKDEKITKAALHFITAEGPVSDTRYWAFRKGAKWGWNAALDQINEDIEKTNLPVKTKEAVQQLAEITKMA